ncbi:hypothetical protein TNIN_295641 [Trichonephila inaurata madagascariensis]|uniref:Uncharacterized protein n=1 Tax=Trichonephila inaurata madagascariensis TaxID=2747483 RepID=A0A8X7BZZ1_9ARAC|nr:hypothetical protein TNIN_295641 [Trichonephila inaurata madagascariensis]
MGSHSLASRVGGIKSEEKVNFSSLLVFVVVLGGLCSCVSTLIELPWYRTRGCRLINRVEYSNTDPLVRGTVIHNILRDPPVDIDMEEGLPAHVSILFIRPCFKTISITIAIS